MYDFFNEKGARVFTLVGAVVTLILVFTLGFSDDAELNEKVRFGGAANFGLWSVYIIGVACVILAVALPIISALDDPKSLIKPLIGVGAIAVVFLLCWAMASDYVDLDKFGPDTDFNLSAGGSKRVGGAVISMYVMTVGAVALIFASEIRGMFK